MKLLQTLCAPILAVAVAPIWSADEGIMIAFTIQRDSQTMYSPKIWSQYGRDASVKVGDALKIEVTSVDLGHLADMKFKLYTNDGSGLKLTSTPRIKAKLDSESSIRIAGSDGATYTIVLRPTKAARPT